MIHSFDYKQLELRMFCQQWPDPTLIHITANTDPMDRAARRIFLVPAEERVSKELRTRAKNGIYGWGYSMASRFLNPRSKGGGQVAEQWSKVMPDRAFEDILKEARSFIVQMDEAFPQLKLMIMATCDEIMAQGWIRDVCGWRVQYHVKTGNRGKDAHELRSAVHKLVSGPSARMTGLGRIRVQRLLDTMEYPNYLEYSLSEDRPLLINDIHDQLVLDSPPDFDTIVQEKVPPAMQDLPTRERYGWDLRVPLVVDHEVGRTWS